MSKKLLGLMLAFAMVTVVAGCSNSTNTNANVSNTGSVVVSKSGENVKETTKVDEVKVDEKKEAVVKEDTTKTGEAVVNEDTTK